MAEKISLVVDSQVVGLEKIDQLVKQLEALQKTQPIPDVTDGLMQGVVDAIAVLSELRDAMSETAASGETLADALASTQEADFSGLVKQLEGVKAQLEALNTQKIEQVNEGLIETSKYLTPIVDALNQTLSETTEFFKKIEQQTKTIKAALAEIAAPFLSEVKQTNESFEKILSDAQELEKVLAGLKMPEINSGGTGGAPAQVSEADAKIVGLLQNIEEIASITGNLIGEISLNQEQSIEQLQNLAMLFSKVEETSKVIEKAGEKTTEQLDELVKTASKIQSAIESKGAADDSKETEALLKAIEVAIRQDPEKAKILESLARLAQEAEAIKESTSALAKSNAADAVAALLKEHFPAGDISRRVLAEVITEALGKQPLDKIMQLIAEVDETIRKTSQGEVDVLANLVSVKYYLQDLLEAQKEQTKKMKELEGAKGGGGSVAFAAASGASIEEIEESDILYDKFLWAVKEGVKKANKEQSEPTLTQVIGLDKDIIRSFENSNEYYRKIYESVQLGVAVAMKKLEINEKPTVPESAGMVMSLDPLIAVATGGLGAPEWKRDAQRRTQIVEDVQRLFADAAEIERDNIEKLKRASSLALTNTTLLHEAINDLLLNPVSKLVTDVVKSLRFITTYQLTQVDLIRKADKESLEKAKQVLASMEAAKQSVLEMMSAVPESSQAIYREMLEEINRLEGEAAKAASAFKQKLVLGIEKLDYGPVKKQLKEFGEVANSVIAFSDLILAQQVDLIRDQQEAAIKIRISSEEINKKNEEAKKISADVEKSLGVLSKTMPIEFIGDFLDLQNNFDKRQKDLLQKLEAFAAASSDYKNYDYKVADDAFKAFFDSVDQLAVFSESVNKQLNDFTPEQIAEALDASAALLEETTASIIEGNQRLSDAAQRAKDELEAKLDAALNEEVDGAADRVRDEDAGGAVEEVAGAIAEEIKQAQEALEQLNQSLAQAKETVIRSKEERDKALQSLKDAAMKGKEGHAKGLAAAGVANVFKGKQKAPGAEKAAPDPLEVTLGDAQRQLAEIQRQRDQAERNLQALRESEIRRAEVEQIRQERFGGGAGREGSLPPGALHFAGGAAAGLGALGSILAPGSASAEGLPDITGTIDGISGGFGNVNENLNYANELLKLFGTNVEKAEGASHELNEPFYQDTVPLLEKSLALATNIPGPIGTLASLTQNWIQSFGGMEQVIKRGKLLLDTFAGLNDHLYEQINVQQEIIDQNEKYREVKTLQAGEVVRLSEQERKAYAEQIKGLETLQKAEVAQAETKLMLGEGKREDLEKYKESLKETTAFVEDLDRIEKTYANYKGINAKYVELIEVFREIKANGEDTKEAIADIFDATDFKVKGEVDQLSIALGGLARQGEAYLSQIKEVAREQVAAFSGAELQQFLEKAQFEFSQTAEEIEIFNEMMIAGREKALESFGLTLTGLKNSMNRESEEIVSNFAVVVQSIQSLGAEGAISADVLQRSIAEAIKGLNETQGVEALKEQIKDLGNRGAISGEQMRQAFADADARIAEITPEIDSLKEAFGSLGLKTKEEMTLAAEQAKSAFDLISQDFEKIKEKNKTGLAEIEMGGKKIAVELTTATQATKAEIEALEKAFIAYAQASIEANGGVVSSQLQAEAAAKGFADVLKEQVTPQIDSTKEAAALFGLKSREELQALAAEAESAFNYIRVSGQFSTEQVQQAFFAMAEKSIAANNGIVSESLKTQAASLGILQEFTQKYLAENQKATEDAAQQIEEVAQKSQSVIERTGRESVQQYTEYQKALMSEVNAIYDGALEKLGQYSEKTQARFKELLEMQGDALSFDRLFKNMRIAFEVAGQEFLNQQKNVANITKEMEAAEVASNRLRLQAQIALDQANLLGEEDLSGLRGALDSANQQILDFRQQAIGTLQALQDELDQLRGNTEAIEKRQEAAKRAELEAQAEAARLTGDREARAAAEEALKIYEQIQREKARIEREETKTQKQDQPLQDFKPAPVQDFRPAPSNNSPTASSSAADAEMVRLLRQILDVIKNLSTSSALSSALDALSAGKNLT